MAFRMGLDISQLQGMDEKEVREIMKTIPLRPLVSNEEWKAIQEYYLLNAPDSLADVRRSAFPRLTAFNATLIRLPIPGHNAITLVRWDSVENTILLGTRRAGLFRLDHSLTLEDSFFLPSPPSQVVFRKGENPLISCMGIMDPNDQPKGRIIDLGLAQGQPITLLDSIKRPVDLQEADLNNDGREDLIVSAFGNFTGSLNVYEKTQAGGYRLHMIHNFPGTRKTVIRDFNNDGLADIMALITQGDEQIALFTNRGNFRFSYQVVLKFPPVYGSSYFELCDFNRDGNPDILYTNGDNADHSYTLKPYHGIRLYLNDGKNAFTESLFFPLYGASMAHARDFDQDGDMDIAAISFFPDFEGHPEQGFVYLENQSGILQPYSTRLAAQSRWITMETADIDQDGDEDILLGALAFPTAVPESLTKIWGEKGYSLLVLRNNLQHPALE